MKPYYKVLHVGLLFVRFILSYLEGAVDSSFNSAYLENYKGKGP